MRDKHILTDADGCILNWNDAFCTFMEEQGHPMVPDKIDNYSISVRHGIPNEDAVKLIREFNEGPYMATLEPLVDSIEYVKKLHAAGFKFTVITSLSDNPQARAYRTANLTKLFGDVFEEIICLKMGANKTEALGRWKNSNLYWIEDHPSQAEAGHNNGLKPILIRHPYNAEYHNNDQFHIVPLENAWRDIYNVVTESYK